MRAEPEVGNEILRIELHRSAQVLQPLLGVSGLYQRASIHTERIRVERIQIERESQMLDGLLPLALPAVTIRHRLLHPGVAGSEIERFLGGFEALRIILARQCI